MTVTTVRFLKTGMIFFLLGALLGVLLAWPVTRSILYSMPGARWDLAHTHLNLLGFVIMVIFGIAYHILPRFAGRPLYSETWAAAHYWISASATAAMIIGFIIPQASVLLWIGGTFQLAGIALGISNIWLTI